MRPVAVLLSVLCLAVAGTAGARQPHDFAPVEAEARQLVDTYRLPGLSLRLARDGREQYRLHLGGYDDDTRVAIASASKWLSALVLARLVEAGTLRWDTRVGELLADAPAATRDITLAQLYSHTSGIGIEDAPCLSSRQLDLQACARQILAQPLAWTPGSHFAYGGNSMQVAGAMAEIASGRAWDDLFIAEMVQPLGLVATDWSAGAPFGGYVRNPNPRVAGGARSTLSDYGRVLDMVLAGGLHEGRSFLRAGTLADMARDRSAGLVVAYTPVPGYGFGYGIGQWVEQKSAGGDTWRVSSPGAFGFTPWVDWRNGSNGVVLVSGSGQAMRDDLTALEGVCLQALDFQAQLHPGAAAPGRAPRPEAGRGKPQPARPRLDGGHRTL